MIQKMIKSVLVFMLTLFIVSANAQNILFINNAEGVANDTIPVSISINNDTAFISFQCDLVLPESFNYVPGSITLSNRCTDHVVNATNVAGNTLRILSYSLSNSKFLYDTGSVATLLVTTPHEAGTYYLSLENGIIGNENSVNIIDSIAGGNVTLKPVGIFDMPFNEDISIDIYPNPFSDILNLTIRKKGVINITIESFNGNGSLINTLNRKTKPDSHVYLKFSNEDLLGNNASSGVYYLQLSIKKDDNIIKVVKKIYYKK